MTAPLYSSVPVRHNSVTASQQTLYQDPETEAANWASANIYFNICTCMKKAYTDIQVAVATGSADALMKGPKRGKLQPHPNQHN